MIRLVGVAGFCIILAFLVAGEILSSLIGHFVPGSVIGMILLFLALSCRLVRPEWIRKASDFLTGNMTLLFIPSAIGIIEQWGLIRSNLLSWVIIMFVCWFMVLMFSGWTQQIISKLKKK